MIVRHYTHFSHGLSSFFIIFPHFLAIFCPGNHAVTLRPRDSLGPGRRSVAVPRTWRVLRTSRWPLVALCPQWLCQGLGRSPDRSWGSPDFDGKNNSPLCQAVFELLWGNDGDGDDDDDDDEEELFQAFDGERGSQFSDKPTGSEYWTKRGRGDWGRDDGIGSSTKSKLNSEKAFWCRPSPEQTRAALPKNYYYSYIDCLRWPLQTKPSRWHASWSCICAETAQRTKSRLPNRKKSELSDGPTSFKESGRVMDKMRCCISSFDISFRQQAPMFSIKYERTQKAIRNRFQGNLSTGNQKPYICCDQTKAMFPVMTYVSNNSRDYILINQICSTHFLISNHHKMKSFIPILPMFTLVKPSPFNSETGTSYSLAA